jgi:hypothetical protein
MKTLITQVKTSTENLTNRIEQVENKIPEIEK